MDSAFAWIGQIATWFGNFVPTWTLVRATDGAVKFLPGGRTEVLDPGIHWYWPVTTEIEKVAVVRQVLDTQPQTIMTQDHEPVYVAGLVVYVIDDLHKYMVENFDASANLDDIVQTAIRKTIVNRDFLTIQAARADVDNRLTSDVQKALEPFGITVEAARITDFSKARVTNMVGSGLISVYPVSKA
jgi:regulator of protease activity HflC (stomatin/prohibitin superfamily)